MSMMFPSCPCMFNMLLEKNLPSQIPIFIVTKNLLWFVSSTQVSLYLENEILSPGHLEHYRASLSSSFLPLNNCILLRFGYCTLATWWFQSFFAINCAVVLASWKANLFVYHSHIKQIHSSSSFAPHLLKGESHSVLNF